MWLTAGPLLHAPLCSARWERLLKCRIWKQNWQTRDHRITWRPLVFRRYLRRGCCYYPRRQMTVSELTGVIKVPTLRSSTKSRRSLCVTSLKTIHFISCFLAVFLQFWFVFPFRFLRLQRVFCFPALAHLLHDPLAMLIFREVTQSVI